MKVKKKTLNRRMLSIIAMVLVLGFVLAGCGGSENDDSEPKTEADKIDYDAIMSTLKPDYDNSKTMLMANATYEGMMVIDDRTYYGRYGVKGEDQYQFVKMELIDDPDNSNYLTSGDWSILAPNMVPKYINKAGDTLYFVAQDGAKDAENPEYYIAKVSTAGNDIEKLADGNGYLTVKGDKMYFTNPDNKYVCTDLEGKNEEVIIDKEVYYPYFITDNWIIYQDDADNESLHVYSLSDKMDFKLNDEPSYNPVVFENAVYFTTYADEEKNSYHMTRIDLTAYKVEGDKVTFTAEKSEKLMGSTFRILYNKSQDSEIIQGMNDANGHVIDKWQDCEDDAYEQLTETYLYLSDKIEMYVLYNDEGAEAKCFMNVETGYGQSISPLE